MLTSCYTVVILFVILGILHKCLYLSFLIYKLKIMLLFYLTMNATVEQLSLSVLATGKLRAKLEAQLQTQLVSDTALALVVCILTFFPQAL